MVWRLVVAALVPLLFTSSAFAETITKTNGAGLAVTDGGTSTQSLTVNAGDVTGTGEIDDVNVSVTMLTLFGGPPLPQAFTVTLTSPSATTVTLFTTLGDFAFGAVTFDDEAGFAAPIWGPTPNQPTGSLANFDPENVLGSWTLSVSDGLNDGVTLQVTSWTLTVVAADAAAVPEPGTLSLFALGLTAFGVVVRRRRCAVA